MRADSSTNGEFNSRSNAPAITKPRRTLKRRSMSATGLTVIPTTYKARTEEHYRYLTVNVFRQNSLSSKGHSTKHPRASCATFCELPNAALRTKLKGSLSVLIRKTKPDVRQHCQGSGGIHYGDYHPGIERAAKVVPKVYGKTSRDQRYRNAKPFGDSAVDQKQGWVAFSHLVKACEMCGNA